MERAKRLKTNAIYLLYRTLQAFGWPILILYFLARGLRDKAYFGTFAERLGFLPRSFKQTAPGAIWLHAVSVGEILSSTELLRQLRAQLPRTPVFVSTSTLAGRLTAGQKLGTLADGVFFAPVDSVFAVRRVLRTLQPSVLFVSETEIWPNLFRETKRTGCGLILVNGRISDRAAPRYGSRAWFFRQVLCWPDLILAQSERMRDRFVAAGAPRDRIRIGGNLKYDFAAQEAGAGSPVRRLLALARPQQVWIAASTMPPAQPGDPDEDDAVIQAFQSLAARHSGLLLMLAPRKPERFEEAARRLRQAGIAFLRRSELGEPDRLTLPGVLLLDTLGELSGLFGMADVVFMGGTLASRGGHNVLEPAFFGRPVITGPHMENFREIAEEFDAAGAWVAIPDAAALPAAVEALLANPAEAQSIGRLARECAESRRGATARTTVEIVQRYNRTFPRYRPSTPAGLVLRPLAAIWRVGARWKRARGLARRRRLESPVISVGNLSMGGTGKTPCTLYLASRLKDAGYRPGILTRGYGRQAPEPLALPAGAQVPLVHTGDEAQILLGAALVPVGIGPERYLTGRLLQDRFGADVLILDDGFQHASLERQCDLVLIDGLDPLAGGEVFPLGRLRQPLEALARADVILVSRADQARALPAAESCLRRYNQAAPIFHARVRPECWVEPSSGRILGPNELPHTRLAAFCGLGNPDSFWWTLRDLGLEPVERQEFADHHTYRPHELRRMLQNFLAAGAEALLTTEKDSINLGEGAALLAPLPLYWLRIRMEVDREAEFLRVVQRALSTPVKSSRS
jgi:tetraacyldisaccharide 4'-kinase